MGMRHFEIKYDLNSDDYKIINLVGSGLYIKITNKAVRCYSLRILIIVIKK